MLIHVQGRSELETAALARAVRAAGHTPTGDARAAQAVACDPERAAWLRRNRPDVRVLRFAPKFG